MQCILFHRIIDYVIEHYLLECHRTLFTCILFHFFVNKLFVKEIFKIFFLRYSHKTINNLKLFFLKMCEFWRSESVHWNKMIRSICEEVVWHFLFELCTIHWFFTLLLFTYHSVFNVREFLCSLMKCLVL